MDTIICISEPGSNIKNYVSTTLSEAEKFAAKFKGEVLPGVHNYYTPKGRIVKVKLIEVR